MKADPMSAGCWVDGNWGWKATQQLPRSLVLLQVTMITMTLMWLLTLLMKQRNGSTIVLPPKGSPSGGTTGSSSSGLMLIGKTNTWGEESNGSI